jgi:uncharacterized membrane protein
MFTMYSAKCAKMVVIVTSGGCCIQKDKDLVTTMVTIATQFLLTTRLATHRQFSTPIVLNRSLLFGIMQGILQNLDL